MFLVSPFLTHCVGGVRNVFWVFRPQRVLLAKPILDFGSDSRILRWSDCLDLNGAEKWMEHKKRKFRGHLFIKISRKYNQCEVSMSCLGLALGAQSGELYLGHHEARELCGTSMNRWVANYALYINHKNTVPDSHEAMILSVYHIWLSSFWFIINHLVYNIVTMKWCFNTSFRIIPCSPPTTTSYRVMVVGVSHGARSHLVPRAASAGRVASQPTMGFNPPGDPKNYG